MMFAGFRDRLLNNWNTIRIIRLLLSIIILVQAVLLRDMLLSGFGLFFLYQALSNTGCCAMGTCAPNITKADTVKEEAEFVEVKNTNDGNKS